MTTVDVPTELVQPDQSMQPLPGESHAHWRARVETNHAVGYYQRGWWDARNALTDFARTLPKAAREVLWALMDATRDDTAAVDKFRAEQYGWRREWADDEDAREAAARKVGVS